MRATFSRVAVRHSLDHNFGRRAYSTECNWWDVVPRGDGAI